MIVFWLAAWLLGSGVVVRRERSPNAESPEYESIEYESIEGLLE
jgi:hypothetical protein